jgi:mono/diheme cytochrome c family protein
MPRFRWLAPVVIGLPGLSCQVDLERMLDQHKYEAYEASSLFEDGRVMRRPPRGTVHRGAVIGPAELVDGSRDGQYVETIPVPVDAALLGRGQNRFRIFCGACHGALGDGASQVAENMKLRRPPSLHEPRIVGYPAGRLYRVITEGYGLMPAYAEDLAVRDRWAVVAFVQALQLSQNVALADLPPRLQQEAQPWLR